MLIAFCIFLVLLVCAQGYGLYRCIKRLSYLVDTIENLNEIVVKCIDSLEVSYGELRKIEALDVASNDPVVARVVKAVKSARDTVHRVASDLSSFDGDQPDD